MTKIVVTYQDYASLPNDGRRYEVLDGEISVTPAPTSRHQRISRNLFEPVHHHVARRGLGEVLYAPLDVILSDTIVVQPDLVYVEHARRAVVTERGIEGAPTLIVEIVSPSTVTLDRVTKPQLYARHGVPFFWIVDPEARTVEAFTLGPAGYELSLRASGASPVGLPPFPDLALVPDSLWP